MDKSNLCTQQGQGTPIPIWLVGANWQQYCDEAGVSWANSCGFAGENGQIVLIPDPLQQIRHVLYCRKNNDFWDFADLAHQLPAPAVYKIMTPLSVEEATLAAFAWAAASYRFDHYITREKSVFSQRALSESTDLQRLYPWIDGTTLVKEKSVFPQLVLPENTDLERLYPWIDGTALVRDLMNSPASTSGGPAAELAEQAHALAERYGALYRVWAGEELLENNFPLIHAVGQTSQAPRLIELVWCGHTTGPRLTLVGKGICLDNGGDVKSSPHHLLMKKDMGGAAHALALSQMIMMVGLPLQLRVLIPVVEKSISGHPMRLDVLQSRKGLTIEVGNTDTEGRLILADALTAACEESPDLIIDCATLTSAACIALGTDIPALFCNHEVWAQKLLYSAHATQDPLWQLPLFQPYARHLKSPIADLNNVGKSSYGGAITAALFLESFIESRIPWIHIDMMAWNPTAAPGRPEGGEAMGLRALFHLIHQWVIT
jgi:leucyl aminopeptidase